MGDWFACRWHSECRYYVVSSICEITMWFGRIVLSQAGLLVVLLAAGIYLFFFYENHPLVILNDPVPTDKEQYQAGDRIVISVRAEIRSQSPSTLYIAWRGDQPQPIPIAELPVGALPLGLQENTFPIAVVPQILLPGTYYLEIRSVYLVSFLAIEREVLWRSTKFAVVQTPASETVPITAYLFMTDQPEASIEKSRELPALPAILVTPVPFIASPVATSPLSTPINIPTSIPFYSPSDAAPKNKPTPEPTATVESTLTVVPTIRLPDTPPIPPLPTVEIPPVPTIGIPIEFPIITPLPPVPDFPVELPELPLPKLPIELPQLPRVP